jgi:TonB family protein
MMRSLPFLLAVVLSLAALAEEPAAAPKDAAPPAPASPQVVPPKVVAAPPAVYPPKHTEEVEVDLRVLIGTDGAVTQVEVLHSGGADFDAAAETAAKQWKFEPAKLNGTPFEARIRIPFVFKPPPPEPSAGAPDGGVPSTADAGPASPEADAGVAAPQAAPAGPSAPLPSIVAIPQPAAPQAPEPAPTGAPEEVQVRGQKKEPFRGTSEFKIEVGQQAVLAGHSPEELLDLAPGIFIANEGGAGHADQVFLRGFDAETGQGIEFTVNGVPINEVDNTDGHGYADTHFIIPEVVQNLRVIEGPFDPHQGDFAQAGSVEYQLGVPDRRLQASLEYGSFGTARALALWAPQTERVGTFAAAQAETSNGYGVSRAYTDASTMAQYEGELGTRGLWRVLATAYATHFKSAGVVRADDVADGAVGYYGTEDPSQGGNAQRYTLSFSLDNPMPDGVLSAQIFATYRTLILDEDFTGFLLDQDLLDQTPHQQRGDGILQQYSAVTLGGRGGYRLTRHWFGEDQSVELGYYARYDHTTPVIDRVRFGTQIPYQNDEDFITDVLNLALYLDLDLHIGSHLMLRGGIRQEYFNYNNDNLCASPEGSIPRGAPNNVPCELLDQGGPRLSDQRTTAAGLITEPKASVLYKFDSTWTASASAGIGATSQDATQISQDELAPFTQIVASEAGGLYHHRFAAGDLSGRLVAFYTHVAQELIFNPALGRLGPTGGTTRIGGIAEARFTGLWVDEAVSATYAHAAYDADHTLVPYVPNVVARSNTVFFHNLPWHMADHAIVGKLGIGLNLIGTRALPLGQSAPPTLVVNATARLRWHLIELGIEATNLLNSQYPLSEFFYASYFPHGTGVTYPTLAPAEAFSAAPPLAVFATLSVILDRESER